MRILLTHVFMGRGGDAVQWKSLAEALASAGHEVTTSGANAVDPYRTGSAGARLRIFVRGLPWWIRDALEISLSALALARAWRVVRRKGVDAIIHRAATYEIMAPVLARMSGVPLIAYLDTNVPAERQFRSESYWRWLHERTMVWLGQVAAVLVTPSHALRTHYSAMGAPADKLIVVHNGVFERHLRLGEEAVGSAPPMARQSECVLGFVGSLSDWHRIDVLLDALARLARAGDGVSYRLVVIGTGRQDAHLKERAARLGIAPLVEWRGPMPHDRAVDAMREFDIAVLPSTLPTGAPMKLSEYAAMGRPIIAPDLPNIRDLLIPDEEAVLVTPENPAALAAAVARLVADPEKARRIGRMAQARVQEWTWEVTARALVAAVVTPAVPESNPQPVVDRSPSRIT